MNRILIVLLLCSLMRCSACVNIDDIGDSDYKESK